MDSSEMITINTLQVAVNHSDLALSTMQILPRTSSRQSGLEMVSTCTLFPARVRQSSLWEQN